MVDKNYDENFMINIFEGLQNKVLKPGNIYKYLRKYFVINSSLLK